MLLLVGAFTSRRIPMQSIQEVGGAMAASTVLGKLSGKRVLDLYYLF